MNIAFFQQVESILATERLDAYRQEYVVVQEAEENRTGLEKELAKGKADDGKEFK